MSDNVYKLYRNGKLFLTKKGETFRLNVSKDFSFKEDSLTHLYQVAQVDAENNPHDKYEITFNDEVVANNNTPFYLALKNVLDKIPAKTSIFFAGCEVQVVPSFFNPQKTKYLCNGKGYSSIEKLALKLYPEYEKEIYRDLFNPDQLKKNNETRARLSRSFLI